MSAKLEHGIPPPPVRPLAQRLIDLVLWGGIAIVLIASIGPVELRRLPLLFTNSANTQDFGRDFFNPDFSQWRLYVAQMWLTVQMALWGTLLAVVIAVPFGLACARNLSPIWQIGRAHV